MQKVRGCFSVNFLYNAKNGTVGTTKFTYSDFGDNDPLSPEPDYDLDADDTLCSDDFDCFDPNYGLLNAAYCGNKNWVEHLLTCDDADINTGIHSEGTTPLFVASREGHSSVVQVLLEQPQIDVNKGHQDV